VAGSSRIIESGSAFYLYLDQQINNLAAKFPAILGASRVSRSRIFARMANRVPFRLTWQEVMLMCPLSNITYASPSPSLSLSALRINFFELEQ
jgi:hypothetical protein